MNLNSIFNLIWEYSMSFIEYDHLNDVFIIQIWVDSSNAW
jgi:hypothetical protein